MTFKYDLAAAEFRVNHDKVLHTFADVFPAITTRQSLRMGLNS